MMVSATKSANCRSLHATQPMTHHEPLHIGYPQQAAAGVWQYEQYAAVVGGEGGGHVGARRTVKGQQARAVKGIAHIRTQWD